MSDLLDQIFGGDLWLGICDTCRQARNFNSERERDLWQKFHPHDDGDGA